MTKERLQYLLDQYLSNKATEEEKEAFLNWYEQTQAQGHDLFPDGENKEAIQFKEKLWSCIEQQIQVKQAPVVKLHSESTRWPNQFSTRLFTRWSVAASLLILIGASYFFGLMKKTHQPQPTQSTIAGVQKKVQQSLPLTTIRNTDARKKFVSLPDGSTVTLYPNSEIQYIDSFPGKERRIQLTGEAFFQVKKDSAHPFVVASGDFTTTALGTSFTITAYASQADIRVALHTGKVVVKKAGHQSTVWKDVVLLPGQLLNCNANTGLAKMETINNKKESITNNKRTKSVNSCLSGFSAEFHQQLLSEVFSSIEKGYGIHIDYETNAFRDILFSGIIRSSDCLSQVLHRISTLHQLTIEQNGKNYRILKN